MPEFQGRQVVTLHNQRDFLFFRRHRSVPNRNTALIVCSSLFRRYAFRSTEKVSLQEIGPRFTLKLRSLRKGLPAVKNLGEAPKSLEFDTFETEEPDQKAKAPTEEAAPTEEPAPDDGEGKSEDVEMAEEAPAKKTLPPKTDEYLWMWKVRALPSMYLSSVLLTM